MAPAVQDGTATQCAGLSATGTRSSHAGAAKQLQYETSSLITTGTTTGGGSIYSPAGEAVGSIAVPEAPANLTFGGAEGTTLFITTRTSLYAVEMTVTGQ